MVAECNMADRRVHEVVRTASIFQQALQPWKLRAVLEACNIFTLRQNVTNADWHDIDIPVDVAIQWLGICSFDRLRCATLCINKYNDAIFIFEFI